MKDAVRARNEDPGQRSRDREKWHEDDEREKLQRKKFWMHIVFDVLLVAATAWLAIHFYTKKLQDENTELRNKVTRLEKRWSTRND